jgi:hypothetical protein
VVLVTEQQRHSIVVERWKASVEPLLVGVVARTGSKDGSLQALVDELPSIFDPTTWSFSPSEILQREKDLVERVVEFGSAADLLAIVPSKQMLPIAARHVGLERETYARLITTALSTEEDHALATLGKALEIALQDLLPPRVVSSAPTTEPALPV